MENLLFTKLGDPQWISVGMYAVCGLIGVPLHLLMLFRLFKLSGWMPKGAFVFHLLLLLTNFGIILDTPFSAYGSFIGRWPFGQEACVNFAYVCMSLGVASIMLCICLCVERYGDVVDTTWYKRMRGYQFFIVAILAVGASFAWSALPLIGYGKYTAEPDGRSCLFNWLKFDQSTVHYLTATTILFFFVGFTVAMVSISRCLSHLSKTNAGPMSKKSVLSKLVTRILVVEVIGWLPYTLTIIYGIVHANKPMPAELNNLLINFSFFPPAFVKLCLALLPLVYRITLASAFKSATATKKTTAEKSKKKRK